MTTNPITARPKSLVLILGAGASCEVGLPSGAELKSAITTNLNFNTDGISENSGGNGKVLEAFNKIERKNKSDRINIEPYLKASRQIVNAMPQAPSIDNFINSHRDSKLIAQCGKIAISASILEAEKHSFLYFDTSNSYNRLEFSNISQTWFNSFFQLLTQNCQFHDLANRFSEVAVVSFNYDRCLEHFLFESIKNYYSANSNDAANLVSQLTIYHPYGTVGNLPWSNPESSNSSNISFGATPNAEQLILSANGIRTFTEGTDKSATNISELRTTVRSADKVVYLGFAFHQLNLQLLFGYPDLKPKMEMSIFEKRNPASSMVNNMVYGTAYQISESDASVIAKEIARMGKYIPNQINLRTDLTAVKLLGEYSRSLAL